MFPLVGIVGFFKYLIYRSILNEFIIHRIQAADIEYIRFIMFVLLKIYLRGKNCYLFNICT